MFDWHGVHFGWVRRAASPSILKTSHLMARRPGFSNVVKGACAIFFIFFGPMLSESAPGQKNVARKSGRQRLAPRSPSGRESQAASRLVIHGRRYRVTGKRWHATCSSRPFGPRVAGRFAACNSRDTVPCHGLKVACDLLLSALQASSRFSNLNS